jgi:hypothetical protein
MFNGDGNPALKGGAITFRAFGAGMQLHRTSLQKNVRRFVIGVL